MILYHPEKGLQGSKLSHFEWREVRTRYQNYEYVFCRPPALILIIPKEILGDKGGSIGNLPYHEAPILQPVVHLWTPENSGVFK